MIRGAVTGPKRTGTLAAWFFCGRDRLKRMCSGRVLTNWVAVYMVALTGATIRATRPHRQRGMLLAGHRGDSQIRLYNRPAVSYIDQN
jgi:hypothetical protein